MKKQKDIIKEAVPFPILAIEAHPDDLEISCGGTLAKYARKSHKIVMVCVTDGRHGRLLSSQKMIKIRRQEAKSSADLIGAELIWIGYPDLGLRDELELRMKIVNIIRLVNPKIIITHDSSSLNPDHRITSKLVFDSLIPSITYTLKTQNKACSQIPVLYYMSTVCSTDFCPEEYVDISKTITTKLEMLSKHKSQLDIYKKCENRDILRFVEAQAFVNGFRCGVEYAEGFRKLHSWTQNLTSRLLP